MPKKKKKKKLEATRASVEEAPRKGKRQRWAEEHGYGQGSTARREDNDQTSDSGNSPYGYLRRS